jgi:carbonic anhydrase
VLGTHTILIMGHSGCGAVTAAMQGTQVPGQIAKLFPYIQPAVERSGKDLEAAVRANVLIQVERLLDLSPLLRGLVEQDSLQVAAGCFDMRTGAVTFLNGTDVRP